MTIGFSRGVVHGAVLFVGMLVAQSTMASVTPLSVNDCRRMQLRNTITASNPLPCARLARVTFSYVDFDGVLHNNGQLVVLDAIAPHVEEIFNQLVQRRFPVNQAVTLETYRGNDKVSMARNNTSGFNGRQVSGALGWSLHAYGAAIDLNPLQNPFVLFRRSPGGEFTGQATVEPKASTVTAVNRLDARPGKPARPGRAEEVIDLFAEHGFLTWGGYWDFPLDYQHFQIGRRSFVEYLARVTPQQASAAIEAYIAAYRQCLQHSVETDQALKRMGCVHETVEQSPT
ncbi:M15 family metallopeptidase [Pseudomonas yamanorum]